jgi:type III secretion system YscD/HrpQ family protein
MNALPGLELRVHSGVHSGACEPLEMGVYHLGAASDNDFVLADPGVQAHQVRIWVAQDGCRWESPVQGGVIRDGNAEKRGELVPLGRCVPVGSVVLSVGMKGSPWPAEQLIRELLTQPDGDVSETPVAHNDFEEGALTNRSDGHVSGDVVPSSMSAPVSADLRGEESAPKATARAVWLWLLGGGLVVALLGGLVFWLQQTSAGDEKDMGREAQVSALRSEELAARRQAIVSVIEALGLSKQVHIEAGEPSGWNVKAALLNDDQLEQLAAALSRLDPRPGMDVTSESDLAFALGEALVRLKIDRGWDLKAESKGGGHFRLTGALRSSAERDELMETLGASLPPLVSLTSRITVPEEVGLALLEDVRSAGVGRIEGQWSGQRMEIQATFRQSERSQWERALANAVRRHPVMLHATVEVLPDEPALRPLPFPLQAVVSGPVAYVVLTSGEKVLIDGSHRGWRLVAVDNGAAVFEDHRGHKAMTPR